LVDPFRRLSWDFRIKWV